MAQIQEAPVNNRSAKCMTINPRNEISGFFAISGHSFGFDSTKLGFKW